MEYERAGINTTVISFLNTCELTLKIFTENLPIKAKRE